MRSAALICFLVSSVSAQDLALACNGIAPVWDLALDGDTATFEFGRSSDMTLALQTTPQDAQWPKALTLIGRGDSAIILLTPGGCSYPADEQYGTIAAEVLTQRGQTPVLLLGCCQSLR